MKKVICALLVALLVLTSFMPNVGRIANAEELLTTTAVEEEKSIIPDGMFDIKTETFTTDSVGFSSSGSGGFYSQAGDVAGVVADDGNDNLALTLNTGTVGMYSSVYFDLPNSLAVGKYKLTVDVKYAEAMGGALDIQIYKNGVIGSTVTIASISKADIDSAPASTLAGYKTVTKYVTVTSAACTNMKFLLNGNNGSNPNHVQAVTLDNLKLLPIENDEVWSETNLVTANPDADFSFNGWNTTDNFPDNSFMVKQPNKVRVIRENGNNILKLYGGDTSEIKVEKSLGTGYTPGTYTVKIKVKGGSAFSATSLLVDVWHNPGGAGGSWYGGYGTFDGKATVTTSGWTTIEYPITIAGNTFFNFMLRFTPANNNANNYLLIDSIEVIDSGTSTNNSKNTNSDLSAFFQDATWINGIYIPANMRNNLDSYYEGTNAFLKLKPTNARNDTTTTKSLGALTAGMYKLKLTLKGGSALSSTNIGGSLAFNVGDAIQLGADYVAEINEKYVGRTGTFERVFEINDSKSWTNLNLWYFHNKNMDANNYLLIDKFELFRQTSPATYGTTSVLEGAVDLTFESLNSTIGSFSIATYKYNNIGYYDTDNTPIRTSIPFTSSKTGEVKEFNVIKFANPAKNTKNCSLYFDGLLFPEDKFGTYTVSFDIAFTKGAKANNIGSRFAGNGIVTNSFALGTSDDITRYADRADEYGFFHVEGDVKIGKTQNVSILQLWVSIQEGEGYVKNLKVVRNHALDQSYNDYMNPEKAGLYYTNLLKGDFEKDVDGNVLRDGLQLESTDVEKHFGFGTINLDSLAEIKNVNGNNIVKLAYDGYKATVYSSMFFRLPDTKDWNFVDTYTLSFDYKINGKPSVANLAMIDDANANLFELNLNEAIAEYQDSKLVDENGDKCAYVYSLGNGSTLYQYKITQSKSIADFYHITFNFKIDENFMRNFSSFRFLINNGKSKLNEMLIDNVEFGIWESKEDHDIRNEDVTPPQGGDDTPTNPTDNPNTPETPSKPAEQGWFGKLFEQIKDFFANIFSK